MINVRLSYNKGYKWFTENDIYAKGFLFTEENQLLKGKELIDWFSKIASFDEFLQKLNRANGLFSVIIKRGETVWAAVDHARDFPLFYYQKGSSFVITDNPDTLKADNVPFELNEDSATILTYSGFVTKGNTLLKNVYQLVAGECLCFEKGVLKKDFHTQFLTSSLSDKNRGELKSELNRILEEVGKRMVKMLDGRAVAIPLSGGFDSRLMVYLLKKNHYKNVLCYTYGLEDCIELNIARRTAEQLGYDFHFIDYGKYKDNILSDDPLFLEYVDFSTNYAMRFEEQDYYAIKELTESGKLLPDTVFIPGNSGAIAGHLLSKDMDDKDFSFAYEAFAETFSLVYPRKKELKLIKKELAFLDDKTSPYPPYLVYENWRFQTTTALAFNGSRIWEFSGFEYLLPLWDKGLYDFFVGIPLEHKYDKNLYKEVLRELFTEYGIFFHEEEIYPSNALKRKVAFRSKLKKYFPFLKRFVNPAKKSIIGTEYYVAGLVNELKRAGQYRKVLCLNGIFSTWYVMKVRKKI